MGTYTEKTLNPYVLDHKPGFFLTWFLYKLFKWASIDESAKEDLKRMRNGGTVVYAIKYRGLLDYLLYHYTFLRKRIPYPKIAFDLNISWIFPLPQFAKLIVSQLTFLLKHGRLPSPYESGFYKTAIEKGITSLIFLVDPKGFLRRFLHAEKDHLQFLLETQKGMDRPIYLVPQLVLYKKTPEKEYSDLSSILFGFKDNPGTVRKIALFFRHHRQAFVDFGPPIDLKAYLESQPPGRPIHDMTDEIRQRLIESIDQQKRVILGPIMKSRQQLMEIVLMDRRLREKIERIGGQDPKRIRDLRKKAREYFDEIAADYNVTYVQLFLKALSWLWKKIFEGVDVDPVGLARVREWARRGPLIYVPSHKSHVDYLVLNYILSEYHMHIPRIAAGKNLAFWPMGHIFRKSGAFFVRRTFRGARLYSEVFSSYIKVLLQEGHPIEFFIEGGRSRNGKLVLPKTGFLSILLRAYHEGFCEDLIFIPASIVYDRIMEEKSYLREIGGDRKEKENFFQIIKARGLLKKRYGKVYIRFQEPFSIKDYLSRLDSTRKDVPRQLAFHLINSINAVTLVTPLSLVATAILANHRRGFHPSWLTDTVLTLKAFLDRYQVPMAKTLANPSEAVQETLALLTSWKAVNLMENEEEDEETFYYVDDDKKVELEYYKNSIVHFFIPHAMAALSLLTGKYEEKDMKSVISDYMFMKNLLKNEFVFDEKEDPAEEVHSIIDYFLDSDYLDIVEGKDRYIITKSGHEKLPIWGALAKTFLESYWVAAKSLGRQQKKKEKDPLKTMAYVGKRFHKLGFIDHIEALSQLNYKNALDFINQEILNGHKGLVEGSTESERLSRFGQRLYDLSHYKP